MRGGRQGWVAIVTMIIALASVGTAWALQALPPGGQVNDDPAAGINPGLSVSGDDPTNADVVGGALTAGGKAVPWAVFRQQEMSGAFDQIFSRSFAMGAWKTRGIRSKLKYGGGEVVVHSSVFECHGLSPAFGPANRL